MTESFIQFARDPLFLTLHSTAPRPATSEPFGFLCFSLGGEEYGVDLKLVSQVVKPPAVTWVPRVPSHFLGVVSIRGDVITLMDLRQLMGIGATEWPRSARILIVDIQGEPIGLLVDSVTQVRRIRPEELERKPNLQEGDHLDHLICIAHPDSGRPILIMDLDTILYESLR